YREGGSVLRLRRSGEAAICGGRHQLHRGERVVDGRRSRSSARGTPSPPRTGAMKRRRANLPVGPPSFHDVSEVAARPQPAVERLVDCASERRFAVSRRQAIPPLLIALPVLEAPGLKTRRVLKMQKLPVRQNLNVPHVVYLVFFVGAFDHGTVACGDVVDVAVLVVLIRGRSEERRVEKE